MTSRHVFPWSWRLDRAWRSASVQWWTWCCIGAGLAAGLAVSVVLASQAKHRQATVRAAVQRAAAPAAAASVATLTVATDFAAALGPPTPATQIVQELQRASAAAGVALAGVQATPARQPAGDQLGRLELAVTLRGPYGGAKQVLKQVVERFPNVTVQRLRMRRTQSPADVETSVGLSVWSAPAAVPAPGR